MKGYSHSGNRATLLGAAQKPGAASGGGGRGALQSERQTPWFERAVRLLRPVSTSRVLPLPCPALRGEDLGRARARGILLSAVRPGIQPQPRVWRGSAATAGSAGHLPQEVTAAGRGTWAPRETTEPVLGPILNSGKPAQKKRRRSGRGRP